jgi:hypothetical protein
MMNVCRACGGTYQTVQDDGSAYFHACASSVPQKHRRDENPPSTADNHAKKIKAVGRGVTEKEA